MLVFTNASQLFANDSDHHHFGSSQTSQRPRRTEAVEHQSVAGPSTSAAPPSSNSASMSSQNASSAGCSSRPTSPLPVNSGLLTKGRHRQGSMSQTLMSSFMSTISGRTHKLSHSASSPDMNYCKSPPPRQSARPVTANAELPRCGSVQSMSDADFKQVLPVENGGGGAFGQLVGKKSRLRRLVSSPLALSRKSGTVPPAEPVAIVRPFSRQEWKSDREEFNTPPARNGIAGSILCGLTPLKNSPRSHADLRGSQTPEEIDRTAGSTSRMSRPHTPISPTLESGANKSRWGGVRKMSFSSKRSPSPVLSSGLATESCSAASSFCLATDPPLPAMPWPHNIRDRSEAALPATPFALGQPPLTPVASMDSFSSNSGQARHRNVNFDKLTRTLGLNISTDLASSSRLADNRSSNRHPIEGRARTQLEHTNPGVPAGRMRKFSFSSTGSIDSANDLSVSRPNTAQRSSFSTGASDDLRIYDLEVDFTDPWQRTGDEPPSPVSPITFSPPSPSLVPKGAAAQPCLCPHTPPSRAPSPTPLALPENDLPRPSATPHKPLARAKSYSHGPAGSTPRRRSHMHTPSEPGLALAFEALNERSPSALPTSKSDLFRGASPAPSEWGETRARAGRLTRSEAQQGWSGEWNRGNMQDVIKMLRQLK